MMTKNLVLAGGVHAHTVTLANLHRFVERGYHLTAILAVIGRMFLFDYHKKRWCDYGIFNRIMECYF